MSRRRWRWLVFSPVLIWNATHGWASFAFQGDRAVGLRFRPLLPMQTLGRRGAVRAALDLGADDDRCSSRDFARARLAAAAAGLAGGAADRRRSP